MHLVDFVGMLLRFFSVFFELACVDVFKKLFYNDTTARPCVEVQVAHYFAIDQCRQRCSSSMVRLVSFGMPHH